MVDLLRYDNGTVYPINMVIRQIDTSNPSIQESITEDSLGPLDLSNNQVKKWLRKIWYFTLFFEFRVTYPSHIDVSDSCYEWSMLQTYDFRDRGNIQVKMDQTRRVCDKSANTVLSDQEDSMLWVMGIAVILSLINFIAIWHYFYGMSEHLQKLQEAYDESVKEK